MIIKKLTIENITSLKGKHCIDMQDMTKNGLFAITGPTGAGKSSILTSIMLAIYGKGPKKTLSSADYVSTGQAEGKIELDFILNNKNYKALWHCLVLKKDGTKRKTISPSRDILEDGQSLGPKGDQVIGLTFDQFCKTVILNQGQFSKFLLSTFTERKEILEKIWGGLELGNLSKRLRKEIKDVQYALEKLSIKVDSTTLLSEEEEDLIKKQVTELAPKVTILNEQKNTIKTVTEKLQDLIEVQDKQIKCHLQQKELKNKSSQLSEEKNSLQKSLQEAESRKKKAEQSYKEESPKLDKAIELLQNQTHHQSTIDQLNNQIDGLSTEIKQLETDLKQIELEVTALESKAPNYRFE